MLVASAKAVPRFDLLDIERMESMADEGSRAAAIFEADAPTELLLGCAVLGPRPDEPAPSGASRPEARRKR